MCLYEFFSVNKSRGILNEVLKCFSICLAEVGWGEHLFSWSHAGEKSVSLALGFAANQKVGKRSCDLLNTRLTGMAQDVMNDMFFMNKIGFSYSHWIPEAGQLKGC